MGSYWTEQEMEMPGRDFRFEQRSDCMHELIREVCEDGVTRTKTISLFNSAPAPRIEPREVYWVHDYISVCLREKEESRAENVIESSETVEEGCDEVKSGRKTTKDGKLDVAAYGEGEVSLWRQEWEVKEDLIQKGSSGNVKGMIKGWEGLQIELEDVQNVKDDVEGEEHGIDDFEEVSLKDVGTSDEFCKPKENLEDLEEWTFV